MKSKADKAPLEATYRFPKLQDTFISGMTVSIDGDREIEAIVQQRAKAEETYGDAIAKGHNAVFVAEETEGLMYEMIVGNL